MKEIKEIVSNNISKLRKNSNMTQFDLATKLNYSDKAVSRWEKGEVVPDIETLCKISNVFNVELTYFFTEHIDSEFIDKKQDQQVVNKIAVSLSLVSVVWAVFTIAYVYLQLIQNINWWQLFVWAVPFTSMVAFFCNKKWGTRKIAIYLASTFVWSILASIYLQFIEYNMWPVFIIGVPLQFGIVFASFIKSVEE